MSDTHSYYERNARRFFEETVAVEMDELHERFLESIPVGGHLLDAGCGSGRDARAFLARGYRVTAFDASPALAQLAGAHLGQPVAVCRFAEFEGEALYDGIWACASLLHVPPAEMPEALARLWRALKPGGVFYCSFKLGQGEREQQGRQFTDADEARLSAWLETLNAVADIQCWRSADRRPERSEQWLNGLIRRAAASVADRKSVV